MKQLLRWTLADHLIDSYTVGENGEYSIVRDGETIHLPPKEARKLLLALIRNREGGDSRIKA